MSSGSIFSSVSVVLPVFNEEARLAANVGLLRATLQSDVPQLQWEIVIVDDASTDASLQIAQALAEQFNDVRFVRHERNAGVDEAILTGIEASASDLIVVLDADLSYPPSMVRELLAPLLAGEADISLASPYVQGGTVVNVPRGRALTSRWANRYLAYASAERIQTFTCIVRAYTTQAAYALYLSNQYGVAAHGILLDAVDSGLRIAEIPAALEWPPGRTSRMRPIVTIQRTVNVLWSGIRFRPMLAAGIPGLIPGLLPAAIAIAVILHARAWEVAAVAGVTIAVQSASLALLGWSAKQIIFPAHSNHISLTTQAPRSVQLSRRKEANLS